MDRYSDDYPERWQRDYSDMPAPAPYWTVSIDNGADYCGDLPQHFASEEIAERAGQEWLDAFLAEFLEATDEAWFDVHPH